MLKKAKAVGVPTSEAEPWFEYQLGQGFDLAAAVLARGFLAGGKFETFIPADFSVEDVEFPRSPDVPASDRALSKWLEDLTARGAKCVVIEDDVQRKGDPRVERPSAYIGDQIVHWCGLEAGGGAAAARAIKQGAFGYPLNAFAISKSAEDVGLVDGENAPGDFAPQVADALVAVIVSAFDATSFATWTPDAE